MRALAISVRDDKPSVQDVQVGAPASGQVRVRVRAASVNGLDAAVAAGYVWDAIAHTFPVVLGRDLAGIVDAIGPGTAGIRVGDRVAAVVTAMALAPGTIAEEVLLDAADVVPLPPEVDEVRAAAAGLAGITALDLLDAIRPTPADTVLVSGATGGVGAFAVQLAAASGAQVLATAHSDESAAFVRDLGAELAVDHVGDLTGAVRSAAPDGPTAIVHCAGDPAWLGALLASGGRMASAQGATDEEVGRDDVTVIPILATATQEKLARVLAMVADGSLRVPVAGTYDFEESPRAISDFAGHKLGKLVVTIR